MLKKILSTVLMVVMTTMMLFAFTGTSSATSGGGNPEVSGKDVTLCHYAGSNNNGGSGKYTKITVDLQGFLNGHADHTNDIWESFTHLKRTGKEEGQYETITVPAQGDTSRLAFDKCKVPDDNEKVAKPEPVYVDKCGTKNDTFSVAPGRGYTVTGPVNEGANQVITVSLLEDFTWADESTNDLRFVKPAFTDEPCDLPETGLDTRESYMAGGVVALLALIGAGFMFVRGGFRSSNTI